MSGALLVAGTTSDAGKSVVTAGICRWLVRLGVSVARTYPLGPAAAASAAGMLVPPAPTSQQREPAVTPSRSKCPRVTPSNSAASRPNRSPASTRALSSR